MAEGGGMVCVHPAPPLMLSQCFLSLSLELVLRHQPGTLACPMPGGQQKMTGRSACSRCGGGTSMPPCRLPACLTTDSYCPALWGLSVWGEGSP